jgi:uncharacterized protein (TIGR03086 family)
MLAVSENLRRYVDAVYLLDAVARRVPNDAWDNRSCCAGWTARDVAGHAAWYVKTIGSLAAGDGPIAAEPEADVAGGDPASSVRAIARSTFARLDRPRALARVVPTPAGEMPLDAWIGVLWIDPLIHAWDLADATGIAHGIDTQSATDAHALMRPFIEALRASGGYADAAPPASNDPIAEFIAFTGRTPVLSIGGGGSSTW